MSPTEYLDQLDKGHVPNHPVTRRGFADLPIDRPTLAAAIYHAMPYEDHESSDRFAELAEAAADEAWLFVRDLIDTQQQLTAALRAVLDLADELADQGIRFAVMPDPYSVGIGDARIAASARLLTAVTDALGGAA